MVGTLINLLFIMLFAQSVSSGHFLHKNVCMDAEVVLKCPHRQYIAITNILYRSNWNIFELKSFKQIFCKAWIPNWADCKSLISYKFLQDQCRWEDTCTIVMDYNPCSQDPLLYATVYYKCTDSAYEQVVSYPLIKYYGNGVPPTTSTKNPDTSSPHKHHKKDDDDNDDDDDDDDDNDKQIHNESQNSKPFRVVNTGNKVMQCNIKIGLGTALGITSMIAIIALICILKFRKNKGEPRPNQTPHSNHLIYDHDHGFQNPCLYQISVSNPGYSQTMVNSVDTANDSDYVLPSYEEAVGNTYEQVNYRTPKGT